MYTEDQLRMVAKALGWEEKPTCYTHKKEYWRYVVKDGLQEYLLSPKASRAIQDFLLKEGVSLFELWYYELGVKRYYIHSITIHRVGGTIKIDGKANTPQEALLDACIQYLGGKNE